MNFQEHIIINPEIRFGKPTVKGTRISVADVLGWMASGMSMDEIIHDYPELTVDAIKACFAYAADKEQKLRIAS